MAKIIGRNKEIAELHEIYNRNQAQFVVIYGRRRVGKTFLVNEAFKDRITFHHAGLSPIGDHGKRNLMKEQLQQFYFSLQIQGMPPSHCPKSWFEAFFMLEKLLQQKDDGTRQVVFLDELPWMDTPRSNFISAFEGFWNSWACSRDNLMLVVCGSATSWILDKLINNHGGLYGRVTREIKLTPFSLADCKAFYEDRGISMSDYDIVQSYMIFGGIPYYMDYFEPGLSLPQNIDKLFFSQGARLADEFDRLLSSVFGNPDDIKKIIIALSRRRAGFTRQQISERSKIDLGGGLTDLLKALAASEFTRQYVPYGKSKREEHHMLTDPFCRFYIHFVMGHDIIDTDFWTNNISSQAIVSWRGFAFEDVCLNHIQQIKSALGIQGVISKQSAWAVQSDDNNDGSQIDLLIVRNDNVVNLCEMKFAGDVYMIDKDEELRLRRRVEALKQTLTRKQTVHLTMVTTYGVAHGKHSGVVQKSVTMNDLFVE